MRLPWPFRRSAPDRGMSAVVADGVPQGLAAPVRHDWRGTGTLRPSFADDPGIRVQRFPEEIAGSQLPPPILAPLGHARTADGPAGLVSGLARPTLAPVVRAEGGRGDLPLRPARTPRRLERSPLADTLSPPASDVLAHEGPPAGSLATPSREDLADTLPALEPRRVAVATTAAARTASLTIARTPDLTLAPTRARTPDGPDAQRMVGEGGTPPTAPPQVAGAPLGAPTRTILRTPSGSRVRLGPPIQRSEVLDASMLELVRPGSRATTTPPMAPVQRHTSPGPDRAAPATPHPDEAAPLAGGLPMTIQDERMAPPSAPIEMAPAIPGGLVLARSVAITRDAQAMDGPSVQGDRDDPRPPAPLVGSASVVPAAPLRPTIAAPNGVPAPIAQGRPQASPGSGRRPTAQRSMGTRPTTMASASPSPAVPARSVAPGPGPGAPGRISRSSAEAPDVRPPTSPPFELGTPLRLAQGRATSGVVADAIGSAHGARREAALAAHAIIQRAADDPSATPSDSAEPASDAPTSSATRDGTPSTVSAPGTAAEGPAAVATIADRDLDEMVRRLYPRLRRSLSSELLVARERSGTLADLR